MQSAIFPKIWKIQGISKSTFQVMFPNKVAEGLLRISIRKILWIQNLGLKHEFCENIKLYMRQHHRLAKFDILDYEMYLNPHELLPESGKCK